MSRRVAVLGIAEHVRAAGTAENLEEMIFAASRGALEASGLARADIDGIVISASDQTDGRAISSMLTAGPAGAYLNDEINIASSPGHAFAVAWLSILSGLHRRVLVSSWGSASETATVGGGEVAERLSLDPVFERDTMTPLAIAAFQAGAQRARRAGDAGARAVVDKNCANAGVAAPGEEHFVAYPLRAGEIAPPCDGAFSLVLGADSAVAGGDAPVWVDGVAWAADTPRTADRDLLRLPHLRTAARDAFERAGIRGPDEVDVFELHDYTPDAELLACEAIGLCADGEAPANVLDGAFARDGARPVNASGGSLGGEAPFGGPIRKVLHAVRQLRRQAGAGQVADAKRALVQIAGGSAGQFQTVIVLSEGVDA